MWPTIWLLTAMRITVLSECCAFGGRERQKIKCKSYVLTSNSDCAQVITKYCSVAQPTLLNLD